MKKLSLILTLSLFTLLLLAGSAAAGMPPRWPQPAWFAQFQEPTSPAPQPIPPGSQPAPPQNEEQPEQNNSVLTAAEKTVLDGINRERSLRGLQPLTVNSQLVKLARLKSKDMATRNYFAHHSPTYGSAYDMMRQNNVRYSYAGENLAKTTSAGRAVQLFLNSSGHRSTLLNSRFNQTGVGIYQSGRQIYVTQMFIGSR